MNTSKTAILFFSYTAEKEAANKQWLKKSNQENLDLAQGLIRQTKQALKKAPFPVFHFSEAKQHGNSFGERLSNAFNQIFEQGYQSVIAVGNDSPGLQYLNWKNLAYRLENNQTVLGRSIRGGAYLIGMHRSQFHAAEFESLAWQSSGLFNELKHYFEFHETAQLHEIAPLRDLNTWEDVKAAFSGSLLNIELKQIISELLKVKIFDGFLPQIHIHNPALNGQPMRAPPVAA